MKQWQWRWKGSDFQLWDDIRCDRVLLSIDKVELRIKPEPFKWTTYAYRDQLGIYTFVLCGHLTIKEISSLENAIEHTILAVYHHEIDAE